MGGSPIGYGDFYGTDWGSTPGYGDWMGAGGGMPGPGEPGFDPWQYYFGGLIPPNSPWPGSNNPGQGQQQPPPAQTQPPPAGDQIVDNSGGTGGAGSPDNPGSLPQWLLDMIAAAGGIALGGPLGDPDNPKDIPGIDPTLPVFSTDVYSTPIWDQPGVGNTATIDQKPPSGTPPPGAGGSPGGNFDWSTYPPGPGGNFNWGNYPSGGWDPFDPRLTPPGGGDIPFRPVPPVLPTPPGTTDVPPGGGYPDPPITPVGLWPNFPETPKLPWLPIPPVGGGGGGGDQPGGQPPGLAGLMPGLSLMMAMKPGAPPPGQPAPVVGSPTSLGTQFQPEPASARRRRLGDYIPRR